MLFKKITMSLVFLLILSLLINLESFKGYSSKDNQSNYSVASLMQSKYMGDKRWNENYFHEAQFPDQDITIFTNIIFSNSFFDKKSCKFNCIITFKNQTKYVLNQDYATKEIISEKEGFSIKFGKNFIELKENNYKIHVEDKNINLNLDYAICNPPHIFGDGIVTVDSRSFLAFCQPIVGANIKGNLEYEGKNISLNGRGSVNHDYNVIAPIKTPRKWRSFWLYNDKYSIIIHTVILLDNTQIDRIIIYKDNILLKSFLNTGLETKNFVYDEKTKFSYPVTYHILHKNEQGDELEGELNFTNFTDKIQIFENLSPLLYSIVSLAVGELYAYRFWSSANFKIKINNVEEVIKINGIGNYVDKVN